MPAFRRPAVLAPPAGQGRFGGPRPVLHPAAAGKRLTAVDDSSGGIKRFVTVDGIRLAYEDVGQGEPVVLLHGFGASSYSWRDVAARLAEDGWRCISPDLLGFGLSDRPVGESYGLDRQAVLVRGLVHGLELGPIRLAGHSYGGGVALVLASRLSPIDLHGLVLVDAAAYEQRFPDFIQLLRSPGINWAASALVPPTVQARMVLSRCFSDPSRITDEAVGEYAAGISRDGGRRSLIATAQQLLPDDIDAIVANYPNIAVPTLVVWGDDDRVVPIENGRRLAREIPGARFEIVPDCGHVPQEERPRQMHALLRGFLTAD